MRLKVLTPTAIVVDAEVSKVVAEAANGSFGLLPRHIDFVAPLVPGLLSFESSEGDEEFVAVDEGVLVKSGSEVLVSTRNATRGADLGHLREAIEGQFRHLEERERLTRSALARLESSMVRRFMQLGEQWYE